MSAPFLSPEWVALHAELGAALPERPGASAHLRFVVGDARKDEVRFDVVLADGRVVAATLDGDGEPDVVLTAPRSVLAAVVSGELDSQTALMQGKVKTSATGPLLAVMGVLQSDEFRAFERELAARTET